METIAPIKANLWGSSQVGGINAIPAAVEAKYESLHRIILLS
jgi:hypothetical protein